MKAATATTVTFRMELTPVLDGSWLVTVEGWEPEHHAVFEFLTETEALDALKRVLLLGEELMRRALVTRIEMARAPVVERSDWQHF